VPYFNSNESVFEALFIGWGNFSLHGHRTWGIFICAFGNAVVCGFLAGISRKEVQLTGTISADTLPIGFLQRFNEVVQSQAAKQLRRF
jgi:hypothetical protein